MEFRANGFVRQFGWARFFRFLTYLPSFLNLFFRLVRDARVSMGPKLLLLGILGYLILPMDLVPDFLPGFGQLDDLAVVIGGLKLFFCLCPAEVVREHVKAIAAGR